MQRLPCLHMLASVHHAAVLCNVQMTSWFSYRYILLSGQLAVVELLVRCMYAAQPDVTTCSQEQLLQLLLLADRYGVPKVLAAVTAVFASIDPTDLQWEFVLTVHSLPAGCAALDACKGLFAAAGDKLQQELGDLELARADAGKRQLLTELPQPALLQLLRDKRTRVASENTVFVVVGTWWQQQWRQQQLQDQDFEGSQQQRMLRHLLGQVRMMVRAVHGW
jgi:hypothetical protein